MELVTLDVKCGNCMYWKSLFWIFGACKRFPTSKMKSCENHCGEHPTLKLKAQVEARSGFLDSTSEISDKEKVNA